MMFSLKLKVSGLNKSKSSKSGSIKAESPTKRET